MKNAGLFVIALVIGLIIGFDLGTRYASQFKGASFSSMTRTAAVQSPPSAPPLDQNRPPTPAEWQDYHSAREQVLQANPQLVAEYKSLLGEIDKHQKDIETAMIKADPKVAPAVAKLAEIRERNFAQAASAAGSSPTPINSAK